MTRFLVMLLTTLFCAAATAHPNHADGPPIKKDDVPALGAQVVALLVKDKRLAPSWADRPVKEIGSQRLADGLVWVVSYENPAEPDQSKRTVYIFFDEFGNFLGGNYSGKIQ